jgi:hypothetical protein
MRWIVSEITLLLISSSLAAQDTTLVSIITETRTHLHLDATTNSGVIRTLPKHTTLAVFHPGSFRSDFYHVVTDNGDTGWVAFPYVRPSSEAFTSNTSTTNVDTQVESLNSPSNGIDPGWQKPRLRRSGFVATDGSRCDAEGAVDGDWRTNIRKNRIDAPENSHAVKWEALADPNLPFAQGGLPKNREGWRPEEAAEVARFEGIPVTVTGYLVVIKPQSSNGEATNCGFTGEKNTDWHVAFVGLNDGDESDGVVIEPTPRFKKRHSNWKRTTLRDHEKDRRSDADSVRITGFLFYDPSHSNHLDRFRSTMWEIHPITRIEIIREGSWQPIN